MVGPADLLLEQGELVNDYQPTTAPMIAAVFAALSGLAVLVGGLAAYALIVALPRRWVAWRAHRLNLLLPSRPLYRRR